MSIGADDRQAPGNKAPASATWCTTLSSQISIDERGARSVYAFRPEMLLIGNCYHNEPRPLHPDVKVVAVVAHTAGGTSPRRFLLSEPYRNVHELLVQRVVNPEEMPAFTEFCLETDLPDVKFNLILFGQVPRAPRGTQTTTSTDPTKNIVAEALEAVRAIEATLRYGDAPGPGFDDPVYAEVRGKDRVVAAVEALVAEASLVVQHERVRIADMLADMARAEIDNAASCDYFDERRFAEDRSAALRRAEERVRNL